MPAADGFNIFLKQPSRFAVDKRYMKDIARRFPENPLLLPKDLRPSGDGLQVISLLNPGDFWIAGKIWLLVRVAEGAAQKEGVIQVQFEEFYRCTQMAVLALNDPDLIATDA